MGRHRLDHPVAPAGRPSADRRTGDREDLNDSVCRRHGVAWRGISRGVARGGAWVLVGALLAVPLARVGHAESDGSGGILVLKEHGTGGQAPGQPSADRVVALAAAQNGWPRAKGQYYTTRSAAEEFITAEKPHYGILSLAAFLALRSPHHLDVIGEVATSLAGGREYALISRNAEDLGGCKGKVLVSDHTDDARFVARVGARADFRLGDFAVLRAQRPLQHIRKLLGGEAACALVDDSQLADLSHLEGADGIHMAWRSAELPPMAVVAFPTALAGERARFRESLDHLCDDEGHGACAEVGIVSLEGADDTDYATVPRLYGP